MAPPAHGFEFFGPNLGPVAIIIGLPAVCYGLVFACNSNGCLKLELPLKLPGFPAGISLFTWHATAVVLLWILLLVVLHKVLPGISAQGVELPDKSKLTYKLNALRCCLVTVGAAAFLSFGSSQLNLGWVYDNYLPLMTASVLLSSALAVLVYVGSFGGRLLAEGGHTGHPIYDFFIGRELNPRIGSLDIKEFCELYPGLIGWMILNLGMAHKQYQQLGYVTPALLLVNAFQGLYVLDALWFERAILTTMDITSDGFGFMLAFGDLAWVPFTYTLQARYLVDHPQALSTPAVVAIVALKCTGYLIFRGSNSQKDQFRRDPEHVSVRKLQSLQTARGRRLLVSGWWGVARHINYFGDWLMGCGC